MRIGLIRHFRITHRTSVILDRTGYEKWIAWYDGADALPLTTPRAIRAWDRCYSSDLRRAETTAARLFDGEVRSTQMLREVPFGAAIQFWPLRMPLFAWQGLSRLAWLAGHSSQPESRTRTVKRVADLVDRIQAEHADESVLLVTHGFLMQLIERELRRRGFRGRVPAWPPGGQVYTFER